MATFRNGKTASESVQVASAAGYVLGLLANGIAHLLARGVSGAVNGIAEHRDQLSLSDRADMRASNDMLCVNVVCNYFDQSAKKAQAYLNSTYDEALSSKTAVPAEVWDRFYTGLYLQTFHDIKATRDWHCRVQDSMVGRSSEIMHGDIALIRLRWLDPTIKRLNLIVGDMSTRYESVDAQAKCIGYKTKPFRMAIACVYGGTSDALTELRDSLEAEMLDQVVGRKFLNSLPRH